MTEPDDSFLEIIGDLEFEIPSDVIDYTLLSDSELSKEYATVRGDLFALDELHALNPQREAAELHSRFAAICSETYKRWRASP